MQSMDFNLPVRLCYRQRPSTVMWPRASVRIHWRLNLEMLIASSHTRWFPFHPSSYSFIFAEARKAKQSFEQLQAS